MRRRPIHHGGYPWPGMQSHRRRGAFVGLVSSQRVEQVEQLHPDSTKHVHPFGSVGFNF